MMPSVIDITKDFPPSRERAVLLELLRVVTACRMRASVSSSAAVGFRSSKNSPDSTILPTA